MPIAESMRYRLAMSRSPLLEHPRFQTEPLISDQLRDAPPQPSIFVKPVLSKSSQANARLQWAGAKPG